MNRSYSTVEAGVRVYGHAVALLWKHGGIYNVLHLKHYIINNY